MSDDESTAYHLIASTTPGHECVMTEMIMEIRDKVNYMVQEQRHIKADVREMKDERKSVIFGILAFVGLTVGGAVIWAIKNGAHSA